MAAMGIKKIAEYLDKFDWRYQMDEKRGVILCGASGANGSYMMLIHLQQNNTLLLMITVAKALEGPNLSKSKLAQLDEALLQINYSLAIGGFERSSETGDVRYRASVPTDDGGLNQAQFRHLLLATCATVDAKNPEIMGLIYGNQPANPPKGPEPDKDYKL